MKLVLANMELYQNWIAKGAAKFTAYEAESYQAGMQQDMAEYHMAGSDAIIQIAGPLSYKYDFWTWLTDGSSYQGLMAQLAAANANTSVNRVILLMDTPGGEITGLPEAARAIAQSSKPVVAMVDPCCASAGLWLASQASRIVSIESGEVGSLGVQCMAVSYAKMFEAEGLDVRLVRAAISPEKNLAHPYEPLTDSAMEYLQGRVDRAGEKFIATVAAGRNVSEADVLANFGQGRMLDADEAIAVGLIDEIGSLGGLLSESPVAKVAKSSTRARYSSMKYRR